MCGGRSVAQGLEMLCVWLVGFLALALVPGSEGPCKTPHLFAVPSFANEHEEHVDPNAPVDKKKETADFILHHVADDTVFAGSFNLSRSGEMNAENVLEVRDAALADQLAAFIDEIRERYEVMPVPDDAQQTSAGHAPPLDRR